MSTQKKFGDGICTRKSQCCHRQPCSFPMVTKSQELCIIICQTWKLVKEVEQHVATENVVTYAGQLDFEFKHGPPILIMRKKQGFYLFNSLSSFASFDPNHWLPQLCWIGLFVFFAVMSLFCLSDLFKSVPIKHCRTKLLSVTENKVK